MREVWECRMIASPALAAASATVPYLSCSWQIGLLLSKEALVLALLPTIRQRAVAIGVERYLRRCSCIYLFACGGRRP